MRRARLSQAAKEGKAAAERNTCWRRFFRKCSKTLPQARLKLIESVTGRIGGELEPRTINLTELAQKRGYECWGDMPASEQPFAIHAALSSNLHFLIDPTGGYMRIWDVVIVLALLVTSIVTPFEVAFILPLASGPLSQEPSDLSGQGNGPADHVAGCSNDQLSGTIFWCNRIIDVIFFKDMIMQFYLKVEIKSRRGTVLVRDRGVIVKRYITGWFWPDLLAVIPYDLLVCSFSSISSDDLTMLSALRLLRLVKIFRTGRLLRRWRDHISFSFALVALVKAALFILFLTYWIACVWGLIGLEFSAKPINCYTSISDISANGETYSRIRNAARDRVNDWRGISLSGGSTGPGETGSASTERSSWVKNFFLPGATGEGSGLQNDDPCNEFVLFLMAYQWSVGTITGAGGGDIAPSSVPEYCVYILIMFIATFVWAYITGCACTVLMNMNPVRTEFEQNMDQLNAMMEEQDVPDCLRLKLRENLREAQHLHRLLRSRELSRDMAPIIKGELFMHLASGWVGEVTFMRSFSSSCIMDILDAFDVVLFARKEKINLPFVKLCVVERGAVGRAGKVLSPGSTWGEDVILADRRLQHIAHTTALTFVQIFSLSKEQLEGVLKCYPRERKSVRKTACKLSLRRAAMLVSKGLALGIGSGRGGPRRGSGFQGVGAGNIGVTTRYAWY